MQKPAIQFGRPFFFSSATLLANEIEVDLQLDRVSNAQQHWHPRLLHLNVLEGEDSGSVTRHTRVVELDRAIPARRASDAVDGEIAEHLDLRRAGLRHWRLHAADFRRNEGNRRVVLGFEQAIADETVPSVLIADEAACVERELGLVANDFSARVECDCAGEALSLANGVVWEIVSH